MENTNQNQAKSGPAEFSIVKRAKSFTHAGRGLAIFLRTTHNAWIQIGAAGLAIFLGFYLNISVMEWAVIIFAIGMVLTAEAFNTAIEIDINLTSPQYHPYARDTKDVAAGAVLIVALMATIVGFVIFLPKIFAIVG